MKRILNAFAGTLTECSASLLRLLTEQYDTARRSHAHGRHASAMRQIRTANNLAHLYRLLVWIAGAMRHPHPEDIEIFGDLLDRIENLDDLESAERHMQRARVRIACDRCSIFTIGEIVHAERLTEWITGTVERVDTTSGTVSIKYRARIGRSTQVTTRVFSTLKTYTEAELAAAKERGE